MANSRRGQSNGQSDNDSVPVRIRIDDFLHGRSRLERAALQGHFIDRRERGDRSDSPNRARSRADWKALLAAALAPSK